MKLLRIAGGFSLLTFGMVMLVTPGPGWVAIGAGLTLLAHEYGWARHWRDRLRDEGHKLAQHIGRG